MAQNRSPDRGLRPDDAVRSEWQFYQRDHEAYVISRVACNDLRRQTRDGQPWDLLGAIRTVADGGRWTVQIRPARNRPPPGSRPDPSVNPSRDRLCSAGGRCRHGYGLCLPYPQLRAHWTGG